MTTITGFEPNAVTGVDALLDTDAYKLDHRRQYPPGTEYVYSNLTARNSRVPGIGWCVFFGLQAYLRDMTSRWSVFFEADIDQVCAEYEAFLEDALGPNDIGTEHIRELHKYGRLPLKIKALPEGTIVPHGVPFLTVENTAPKFFWLPNYIETDLNSELWQPITSATTAWRNRLLLDSRATSGGSETEAVDWQGHDFSYRGMVGRQGAAASGAAHLLSFKGTDTLPALRWVKRNYPNSPQGTVIGRSVRATEHSVMCAGTQANEAETFARLLNLYPTGIVSIVSDTWDIWNVCTNILPALKDKILARDGKLVIRPDSGDPEKILCGDPDAPAGSAARRGVVNILWDIFGGTVNAAGYRELDSHIGAIYGDSITHQRADSITANLMAQGYVSITPVLGFGSYTYQYVTRDTFSIAMKATWVQVDNEARDIAKDPITDPGKRSARGRVAVTADPDSHLVLLQGAAAQGVPEDRLRPVFSDGAFIDEVSFHQVRATLRADWARYAAAKGWI